MCANKNCNCQKQITFTPRQYMLEGGSIKTNLKKIFKGTEAAWNKFLKPALNIAAPIIGTAVAAKTKNAEVGKATGDILKSISAGKILTLTDQYMEMVFDSR